MYMDVKKNNPETLFVFLLLGKRKTQWWQIDFMLFIIAQLEPLSIISTCFVL